MPRRGVRRTPSGIAITVALPERDLLASLPDQLRSVLGADADVPQTTESGPLAAVHARLFPRASDDAEVDADFRDLLGESLLAERLERLDRFTATLEQGTSSGRWWQVEVDAEDAEAWLACVNDARLTLGVLCEITDEEVWERAPDPDDQALVVLHWLGWLEDAVVAALSGHLDAP